MLLGILFLLFFFVRLHVGNVPNVRKLDFRIGSGRYVDLRRAGLLFLLRTLHDFLLRDRGL